MIYRACLSEGSQNGHKLSREHSKSIIKSFSKLMDILDSRKNSQAQESCLFTQDLVTSLLLEIAKQEDYQNFYDSLQILGLMVFNSEPDTVNQVLNTQLE